MSQVEKTFGHLPCCWRQQEAAERGRLGRRRVGKETKKKWKIVRIYYKCCTHNIELHLKKIYGQFMHL